MYFNREDLNMIGRTTLQGEAIEAVRKHFGVETLPPKQSGKSGNMFLHYDGGFMIIVSTSGYVTAHHGTPESWCLSGFIT